MLKINCTFILNTILGKEYLWIPRGEYFLFHFIIILSRPAQMLLCDNNIDYLENTRNLMLKQNWKCLPMAW